MCKAPKSVIAFDTTGHCYKSLYSYVAQLEEKRRILPMTIRLYTDEIAKTDGNCTGHNFRPTQPYVEVISLASYSDARLGDPRD